MEHHSGQIVKSRVAKVDCEKSWTLFISKAKKRGCHIFVHFTASWCVPSLAMNPFFEEMAHKYPDVLFASVDMDRNKAVAKKMEVKAMPTFVLMKGGNVIAKLVGANPEEIRRNLELFVGSHQSTLM